MLNGKKIAVVIPAHNEEKLIKKVLSTIPSFVDSIIVVNDLSKDRTKGIVEEEKKKDKRVKLVNHEKNLGVGAAIVSGYKISLEQGDDVTAVMAGDFQMAPSELQSIVGPVVKGEADYVKGNRLFTGEAWKKIPKIRYIGNAFLSLSTKIASGYWHVADSQCGYTAISNETLNLLDLNNIYPRYGFPNDLLVKLNVVNAKVIDVPVTPIYGVGERSGIKIWRVIPLISLLLIRLFFFRIKEKYIIRDFHPLVFFYLFGTLLFLSGSLLGLYETYLKMARGISPPAATITLVAMLIILGLQSIFFAMWFDMEYNRELK